LKFDIVIPTHHRREKLLKCLGSIEQARKNLDCYSYVYVYYTDEKEFNADSSGLRFYSNILPRLLTKKYRASEFWNDHLKQSNADVMIYLNDDVVLEINALQRVKVLMDKHFPDLDGVVAIAQQNIPEDQACKSAFGAVGTKFADRFPDRKVFYPEYERFFLDSELGEYAEKQGKLFYSRDETIAPLLTHYHPAFFKDMKDTTHDSVRKFLSKDKVTNNRRKKNHLLWGESFEL
jgi:hypothetical protein